MSSPDRFPALPLPRCPFPSWWEFSTRTLPLPLDLRGPGGRSSAAEARPWTGGPGAPGEKARAPRAVRPGSSPPGRSRSAPARAPRVPEVRQRWSWRVRVRHGAPRVRGAGARPPVRGRRPRWRGPRASAGSFRTAPGSSPRCGPPGPPASAPPLRSFPSGTAGPSQLSRPGRRGLPPLLAVLLPPRVPGIGVARRSLKG